MGMQMIGRGDEETFPRGGDERLNNMDQVVLKPQNMPEHLHLLADSPPSQGYSSISDLFTEAHLTDRHPAKIWEAIQTHSGLWEITVAESTEQEGWLQYWGKIYVPERDQLQ